LHERRRGGIKTAGAPPKTFQVTEEVSRKLLRDHAQGLLEGKPTQPWFSAAPPRSR